MSAKSQKSRIDDVRNAATGYAVVVLGIVCFVLALAIVMTGVRVIAGLGSNSTTTNAPVAPVAASTAMSAAATKTPAAPAIGAVSHSTCKAGLGGNGAS